MEEIEALAGLARTLKQLLLASYGLFPQDLAGEIGRAVRHLGGDDAVLLLSDYDQQTLVDFDGSDDLTYSIDGPGPGRAFREEVIVDEPADGEGRRLWIPAKDSADRLGVFGVVDDGSVPHDHWETVASLIGELVVSKSAYSDHVTLRKRTTTFSLAAEMRWALLPPLTFTSPDLTIAGLLQPSHGIAGDAFDYGVTDRLASIGIFDAMGHGLEASRMANLAVASYRNSRRADATPVAALRALDEVIASEFGDSRFVTAQFATLDIDTGRMHIASAGHPPPIRLGEGRDPETIECHGARPAGLATDPAPVVVDLDEGDSVLFCTDGVTDARSPQGEWFGEERLAAMIADLTAEGLPPSEVIRRCVHAVRDHQGDRTGDDATVVMVSWKPKSRQYPQRQ